MIIIMMMMTTKMMMMMSMMMMMMTTTTTIMATIMVTSVLEILIYNWSPVTHKYITEMLTYCQSMHLGYFSLKFNVKCYLFISFWKYR